VSGIAGKRKRSALRSRTGESLAISCLARIVLHTQRSIFLVRNGGSQAAAPSGAAVCFCIDRHLKELGLCDAPWNACGVTQHVTCRCRSQHWFHNCEKPWPSSQAGFAWSG